MTKDTDDSNYTDILQTQWDDIPEPIDTPEGSWRLRNKAAKFQPKETVEKADGTEVDLSDRVMFVDEPVEAMDDVDAKVLEEAGDYDFSENVIFTTFWLKKRADWDALRKHLAVRGVEVNGSVQESLKATKGTEVIGYVQNKTVVRNGKPTVQTVITSFEAVE